MNSKSGNTQGSGSVGRVLTSLTRLLDDRRTVTIEKFTNWQEKALLVNELFGRFALGVIEWDKMLGRPTTPTLAEGFQIESWYWYPVMEYTPTGVQFVEIRTPLVVSSWDSKTDEQKWRVYFFISNVDPSRENFVEVRFNPQSSWTPRNKFFAISGFKVIQPSSIRFRLETGNFLPWFEVVLEAPLLGP